MIYYAHHIDKYGTEEEQMEMQHIQSAFPDEKIFNPATQIPQTMSVEQIMDECLLRVSKCDALVFSSVCGVIGMGVFSEIKRARTVGMPVYYLRNGELLKEDAGELRFLFELTGLGNRMYANVTIDNYSDGD